MAAAPDAWRPVRDDSTLDPPGPEAGPEAHEPILELPGGGRIGPYRLIGAIGRGGMGMVWRAEAAESCPVPAGKVVALKLLHRVSPEERRRAKREVGYLQALQHPGIVRVLDVGEHQGRPWIVMALVEGRRLDQVMAEEGPFATDRAARITIGALEALHLAHLAGILHRDIKPGNLMLRDDGQVVVLDFGLASAPEFESRLTASDTVIGTPAYMSPEQAAGERAAISPRSDVYAIGAVLYEMAAGVPPFAADDPRALLRRVIEDPTPRPSLRRAGVSRDLETVILRAMAKDPQDRYRSAEAMAADLRRLLEGRPPRATRPGQLRPFLRACWRRRRSLALAGLAAFVLAGATILAARAALQRLRRDQASSIVQAQTDPEWATELVQVEPLLPSGVAGGGRIRFERRPSMGPGVHLAQLPPSAGPVRLAATVTMLESACEFQVMVSDRDIGRGYAVRIAADPGGTRLDLLRDGKAMSGRVLPALRQGVPVRLSLVRGEDTLEARLGDAEPVSFLDLVPLEGPDAAGNFVLADPSTVRVAEVVLERLRAGLVVSALAPADMLRQDGRFERALSLYDGFIADHPDSPQTRDAQLRAGLCLEGLGRDQPAFERFVRVAQENRLDRRYVLLATFHAWSCALRLGRLDEAEGFFAALRNDYRADQLLPHVPADLARQLVDDHMRRAEAQRSSDPARALALFTAAADVAAYLRQPDRAAVASTGAGDLLLDRGDAEAALERFRQVADDSEAPATMRAKARLKSAEALRLAGRTAESTLAYQEVIADPTADDLVPWARLWLGDLLDSSGDPGSARAAWAQAADAPGLAGVFARALLGREPMPADPPADPWFANDDAFIRARLAERHGDHAAWLTELRRAAALAGDWPAPLARQYLNAAAASPSPDAPP